MQVVNINAWYCGFTYGLSTRGYEGKMALKRETYVRRQQMVDCNRWLTGDVASAHVVIAKNQRNAVTIIVYRMLHKNVYQSESQQPRTTAEKVTHKENHKSKKILPLRAQVHTP
jgi:hypothetical protein